MKWYGLTTLGRHIWYSLAIFLWERMVRILACETRGRSRMAWMLLQYVLVGFRRKVRGYGKLAHHVQLSKRVSLTAPAMGCSSTY
jgi:hypothetical protein